MNYRGVNVLPNLAKVFERIIYDQLKFIISPKIGKTQHGFLSSRNIETNLLELTTRIHDAFESNAQLDVFYADISRAFDSVNPDLLIRKLATFPVSNRILIWFNSYLRNRSQYVRVGSAKSHKIDVKSGVGQGTILGPLLFLIFFNDSDGDTRDVFSLNFADDKKIGTIVKTLDNAKRLQSAINNFLIWCESNGLDVNLKKCKMITFTHKRNPVIFDYKMNGQPIERVTQIRDLGVILDQKLNFNAHIEYITTKSKAVLHFVNRQSQYFQKDVIKILYMALVRSNLEFASSIWSPHHASLRDKLESIQKQFLINLNGNRIHNDADSYALSPYKERCELNGLTTLLRRRVNATIMFIHSIISGKFISPHLRSLMDINIGIRTLRNPEFIRLRYCRTDHSTWSSFNNACRMFNHSALFIDPTLSHDHFKKKLLKLPDTVFGPWTKL